MSGVPVFAVAAQGILLDHMALVTGMVAEGSIFLGPTVLWKLKKWALPGYDPQSTAQTDWGICLIFQ